MQKRVFFYSEYNLYNKILGLDINLKCIRLVPIPLETKISLLLIVAIVHVSFLLRPKNLLSAKCAKN